jgi:hypothetical protein
VGGGRPAVGDGLLCLSYSGGATVAVKIEQRKLIGYHRLLKAVLPNRFPKPINPQLKVLKQEVKK